MHELITTIFGREDGEIVGRVLYLLFDMMGRKEIIDHSKGFNCNFKFVIIYQRLSPTTIQYRKDCL